MDTLTATRTGRIALVTVLLSLTLAPPADARHRHHRGGWRYAHQLVLPQPACPAGDPVQTITVINQADVPAPVLALVERAAVKQSLQVRRWWGSPCIQFGPGGWKLYLKKGPFQGTTGVHFWNGSPYMLVWTGQLNYEMWAPVFTHEMVETLVDPTTGTDYIVNDTGYQLEVADPVELRTYRIERVNVTDFVLPSYYADARTGTCSTSSDDVVHCDGPLIAPVGAPGPYDQAGILTRPWDAQYEQQI